MLILLYSADTKKASTVPLVSLFVGMYLLYIICSPASFYLLSFGVSAALDYLLYFILLQN